MDYFVAGAREKNGRLFSAGGRVLGVTAVDDTLQGAVDRAYQAVDHGKVFFLAGRPRDGEERKNPHAQHGVISKPNPGLDSVLGLYEVFVQNRVFRGSGCHMAAYG